MIQELIDSRVAAALGWKKKRMSKADGSRHMVWVNTEGQVHSWANRLPAWRTDLNVVVDLCEARKLRWTVSRQHPREVLASRLIFLGQVMNDQPGERAGDSATTAANAPAAALLAALVEYLEAKS